MSPLDDLGQMLKKLRLSGLLETLPLRLGQAVDGNLPYEEFLLRLVCDEVERRNAKQLQLRLGRAGFESGKTLEDFDFSFNPQIPKARVIDLCTCAFVARRDNVLLIGPAGVGKSHIAQALGHRACRAGYATVWTPAHKLFAELRASRADGSYERKMARLTAPDVLIIDDLGLRSLRSDEPEDLYELIRQRYETGSTIITSNRAVEEWPPLFIDPLLASAAMDRLLHHAHIVVMDGDSYRNPPRKRPTRPESAKSGTRKEE